VAQQAPPPAVLPQLGYSSLSTVRLGPINASITAFPLNSPPINGFVPQVVFGLTNQQAPNDEEFKAHPSSSPGGTSLPSGGAPQYFVATFDTGSQSHLVSYNDAAAFNLAGANRAGNYEATLFGADGEEITDVSDPIGVYMTGFNNATGGTSLAVTPGTMIGQWNTSILTAQFGSTLPNLIGVPMVAQYQTVIRNSQTRRLTVGAQTFRSPQVDFQAQDTAYPSSYVRLTFDLMGPSGVSPNPVFIPSLDNFNNFADNPTNPTFWAGMFAKASGSDAGHSISNEQFLFDTGAQVTVVSQDTAAAMGFYSAGPNPSTPDFFVSVTGVGGQAENVPGFYADQFSVLTNGGPITWTNVPLVVLDLIDPRDGIGFVPGILGMNLFTDRDLIINGGTRNPSVAISPLMTAQWNSAAGGTWGDDFKWLLGVPEEADAPANFLSSITTPQTITVDTNYTIGSLMFDNANRYTLSGPGTLTLDTSTGPATIRVVSGSHTINAPITLSVNTNIQVDPPAGVLTINSDVTATSAAITKLGPGTVEMKNVRSAGLTVSAGKVRVLANGGGPGTSVIGTLSIAAGAALDLTNNDLVVNSASFSSVRAMVLAGFGNSTGGITSSTSNGSQILALFDNALIHAGTWNGQPIGASAIVGKYTYFGDVNFDGQVTGDDYTIIDSNLNTTPAAGLAWLSGDANLDGIVTGDDYTTIDSNLGLGTGNPLSANALGASSPVPEVGGVGSSMVALAMLARRRRRA